MTISGQDIHRKIKTKIKEVEGQYNDYSKDLELAESNITKLVNEREQTYISLAITYLPQMDADSVRNTLSEMQSEVERIYKEKQKRRKTLDQLILDTRNSTENLKDKLEEVDDVLNKKAQERDETLKIINEDLSNNDFYPG